MARTLWPGEQALGKCLLIGDPPGPCARIVGIVEDARRDGLRDEPAMQYYIPFGQERGFGGTTLLVRPRADMKQLRAALPGLMAEYGTGTNYVLVETMQEELDPEIRPWRLGATLFCVFGGLALLIATIGMFSVIAYNVTQRRMELGIRRALGATVQGVIGLIARQGLALAIAGIAIGAALALLLGRFIEPLLFDTSARDLPTLLAVSIVLLLAAGVACVIPALRASRIPPVEVLRTE
jgi:ABC-type antimicrobial peptide transport system permease subunit